MLTQFCIDICFFNTQSTYHLTMRVSKLHFSCPFQLFTPLLFHYPTIVTEQHQLGGIEDSGGWSKMTFFLRKTPMVSLTIKRPFFTTSPPAHINHQARDRSPESFWPIHKSDHLDLLIILTPAILSLDYLGYPGNQDQHRCDWALGPPHLYGLTWPGRLIHQTLNYLG